MKHRIGLVYVPGALPCFEMFGNLPTDLVSEDGLVDGRPASEVLDMIIIPGGSLVESKSIQNDIAKEILEMAEKRKFVLGICSGFQILSKGTDIGRLSPKPIFRQGMGLLDVDFKPLICTDQVKAKVIGSSCLTEEVVGAEVSGFHCHTYGNITLHGKAKPILVSHVKRQNYYRDEQDIVSGVTNSKGNVVGFLPHALLDKNAVIIEGISKALGINSVELEEIKNRNIALQMQMKNELGISTCVYPKKILQKEKCAHTLLITGLESGCGKTVVTTGLAGALKKKGWKVGVIKIGGDIRDIVPSLYLTKEPMQDYSSIEVAGTGWQSVSDAADLAERNHDFVLVEGAMNAFTGLLYDKHRRPNSTAEVAAALGVPTVVVAGCDKEGIEGGIVSGLNYVRFLKKLGIKIVGIILNKVYMNYMSGETRQVVKQAFEKEEVEVLGIIPVSDIEGRGAIPEIEIKYEEFTAKALNLVEMTVNLEKIVEVAKPFSKTQFDYPSFVAKFKKSL